MRCIPPLESHDNAAGLQLPQIYLGAATLQPAYNSPELLSSEEPYKVVLEAARAGLLAIDTSPYYATSETILGDILGEERFRAEFPRHSYKILTKCGRYGPEKSDFDYSLERIRKSVAQSCKLLRTDYLDAVYLHDVEFVAEDVGRANAGGFLKDALTPAKLGKYGLEADQAGTCHGKGDELVVEAARTLFALKDEGKIRAVGIAGLPLPALLRLARLINKRLNRSLDLVQNYSQMTLQNDCLRQWIPLFKEAGVKQVVNASPLSMGLLGSRPPPPWHPAPLELKQAVNAVVPDQAKVALRYGLRAGLASGVPTVTGISTVRELHEALEAFWEGEELSASHRKEEDLLRQAIDESGYRDWIWAQASDDATVNGN